MPRKRAEPPVTAAVESFLAELPLAGAHKPLASVARLLAESLEAAPEYARARIAKELRELLTEIESQVDRENEIAERREARRRQGAWLRDAQA
jgi:hypothetical protein